MAFISGGLNFESHAKKLLGELELAGLEVALTLDEHCASYRLKKKELTGPVRAIMRELFPGHKQRCQGKVLKIFRASKGSDRLKEPASLRAPAEL